jgi:alpha-L-fucosidase
VERANILLDRLLFLVTICILILTLGTTFHHPFKELPRMSRDFGIVRALRRSTEASITGVIVAAVLLSVHSHAQSSPPEDRSTAKVGGAAIDETWQKASAKYNPKREAILAVVEKESKAGPFQPDWQSLSNYKVPEWYKNAKFGIFIHWGVYSVPAYGNEWYPREMYIEGSDVNKHHVATYGPVTKFGYKDFIPQFKAEKFDPQAWASLFKNSGARYVVPVFEHHDGFTMYDSDLSDWTAKKMGPHRDVVGDLAEAIRAEGLHLGASSHRIEHNWFLDGGRKQDSDVNDPQYAAFYGPAHPREIEKSDLLAEDWTYVSPAYAKDWVARNAEIVQKYHPELIFFDWWIGQASVRPYLAEFAAYYYNESSKRGQVGVINYKLVDMEKHSGVLDIERGQASGILPETWQTDTSVSNKSWGYIENDTFKTPEFVVQQLADVVSKNGNLLLNIGPRSDGTIPDQVKQVLLDVGDWLKVNGDAIYDTRPWTKFGEGPTEVQAGSFHDTDTAQYTPQDFRFTTKNGSLYAIEMAWPTSGEVVIRSLCSGIAGARRVSNVSLLSSAAKLSFTQQPDGLHIQVPQEAPGKYAYAYRIDFEEAKQ